MCGIACEYGIPVGLFDAMIIRESRYRTDALSPKNAFGLTQLMPGTAASLGVNRHSVEDNLRGGARYLRQQTNRFVNDRTSGVMGRRGAVRVDQRCRRTYKKKQ